MRHARRRRWRFTSRAHWLLHEVTLFVFELAVCFGLLGLGCALAWIYVRTTS